MDAAIVVLVSLVVNWFINGVKDATNKNWNGLISRITALAAAVIAVSGYAHQTVPMLDTIQLTTLNFGAQIALAVGVAASGGTIVDILRTFNRSDESTQPTLVP